MTYDEWKQTPPDTDECTDDADTCECPECREWRRNYEPPVREFDESLALLRERKG